MKFHWQRTDITMSEQRPEDMPPTEGIQHGLDDIPEGNSGKANGAFASLDREPGSRAGGRAVAVCATCRELVDTVWQYRTLHLEQSDVDVQGVLVDVCQRCGAVCTIAPESLLLFRAARGRDTPAVDALRVVGDG